MIGVSKGLLDLIRVEPSALDELHVERPSRPRRMELNLTDAQILSRIHRHG